MGMASVTSRSPTLSCGRASTRSRRRTPDAGSTRFDGEGLLTRRRRALATQTRAARGGGCLRTAAYIHLQGARAVIQESVAAGRLMAPSMIVVSDLEAPRAARVGVDPIVGRAANRQEIECYLCAWPERWVLSCCCWRTMTGATVFDTLGFWQSRVWPNFELCSVEKRIA